MLGLASSAVLQAVVSEEAMSRALFKKGAELISSLAFIFASTNSVAELGIVLCLLMGWQFMCQRRSR